MPRFTTGPNRTFSIRTGLIRLIAVTLSIMLLLSHSGCAPHPYHLPPPLSEEARARMGTVGVVSAEFVPEMKLFALSRGRVSGAAEGMAFEVPTYSGSAGFPSQGGPAALVLYVGVILAALLAAEIYRAATAIPAEEVERSESNIRQALIELGIQEAYKERFLQTATEQAPFNFALVEQGGPKTRDEMANYGHLKEMGIDTVVELSVLSIGFQGTGGQDPFLWFLMDARARVVSISDGSVLYENMLEYKSAKRKFSEWISGKGELFLEELDRGYGTLSEKLVEELFLRYEVGPGKDSGGKAEHTQPEMAKG